MSDSLARRADKARTSEVHNRQCGICKHCIARIQAKSIMDTAHAKGARDDQAVHESPDGEPMPDAQKVELTPEEKQCLRLGLHILAMLRDLMSMPSQDAAYCHNTMSFRASGTVHVYLVREDSLAQSIDKAIAAEYELMEVTRTNQDKVQ